MVKIILLHGRILRGFPFGNDIMPARSAAVDLYRVSLPPRHRAADPNAMDEAGWWASAAVVNAAALAELSEGESADDDVEPVCEIGCAESRYIFEYMSTSTTLRSE